MVAANDHLDDALVLTGSSGTTTLDFTGADYLEPGEQEWWWADGPPVHSLWATWTAPSDGVATFTLTDGAPAAWDIEVWEYVSGWNFATNGYDDLAYFDQDYNTEGFAVTEGTTYLIWVDDFTYDEGGSPSTAATLSWQLLPLGVAGAVGVEQAPSPWLPLHHRVFIASLRMSEYHVFPDAVPPLDPTGSVDFLVGPLPDNTRLIRLGYRLLRLTDEGDKVLYEVLSLPLESGYGNGFSGGGADVSTQMLYAMPFDPLSYDGRAKADAAGQTVVGEVVCTYPEGVRVFRLPSPVTVPLSPAPASFTIMSDLEAAYLYAHTDGIYALYHRSRPGVADPTTTHDGPLGNPVQTIHVVSGTQIDLTMQEGAVYVASNYDNHEWSITGTADAGTHLFPAYYSGVRLLIGPNLPGETESVMTFSRFETANPSNRESCMFRILWE